MPMSKQVQRTHAGPAYAAEEVTKGTPFTLGSSASLWIGTAGTLNFTDLRGTAHTDFPAKAGLLPIGATSVQSGGTADDIWALF